MGGSVNVDGSRLEAFIETFVRERMESIEAEVVMKARNTVSLSIAIRDSRGRELTRYNSEDIFLRRDHSLTMTVDIDSTARVEC